MQKKARYSNNAFFDDSKVIIITGASSGIGKAVAQALVRYKPKLVLTARRKRKLYHTANLLKKQKLKVLPIVSDIRNREDRTRIIDLTLKMFGRIDVLINNAGLGKANLFLNQPEEEIDQLIETNILSLIKMTHAVVPIMEEQGGGSIINISSSLAMLPVYPFAVYCATKSAVKVFGDGIRQELKDYGISVSTVLPGPYNTEFNKISGLNDEIVNGKAVDKLAIKIAKLTIKPKNNLIQPRSFIPLLWITEKFGFLKEKITLKIAEQIYKARIANIKKIEFEETKLEEKEIELAVATKTKN
ncbi:MAG: putative oxidoreductase [Candidatus Heimdallarchaeota archaeon AB_125]|nr:MAG: putative oxidoreductase [Candidatus Heimdallarchaeota archaeon AB_125]